MRILFICFRSKGDLYETRIQNLNSFLRKLNETKKILITFKNVFYVGVELINNIVLISI